MQDNVLIQVHTLITLGFLLYYMTNYKNYYKLMTMVLNNYIKLLDYTRSYLNNF